MRKIPSLRRHKPTSQAVVTLSGKDYYLGIWPPNRRTRPADIQVRYERLYALEAGYGILIYTGTLDAEGTLGGLIEAGKHVARHLETALRMSNPAEGPPGLRRCASAYRARSGPGRRLSSRVPPEGRK